MAFPPFPDKETEFRPGAGAHTAEGRAVPRKQAVRVEPALPLSQDPQASSWRWGGCVYTEVRFACGPLWGTEGSGLVFPLSVWEGECVGRRLGGDTWRGVPSFHQRRLLSYWFANLLEKIDVKTSVGSWMCSCGDLRTGRLLCAGCREPGMAAPVLLALTLTQILSVCPHHSPGK